MGRLYTLGLWITRHAKLIVIAAIILAALSAVVGTGAMERFSLARFQASGSESVQAGELLESTFGVKTPNLTIVVETKDGTVDSPAVTAAGKQLTDRLANDSAVAEVSSYWTSDNSPVLRSEDGTRALIIARVAGDATEARAAIAEISPTYMQDTDVFKTYVGGQDEVFRQVSGQARQDFVRAEIIILPIMIVLLYLVYRRLSAALLTLGIGIFAVFGTLALLALLLPFVEISTFASNLTLVMGLGLGLDYSLLIISRFREERRRGSPTPQAIATTLSTAGHTVLFSGLTVAISLLALLLFPFPFLQSFAYAGIGVVLTSIIGATIILPAALALLGDRVLRRKPSVQKAKNGDLLHRGALRVMRRPLIYGALALVIILSLASPALNLRFGLPDDRILPPSATSRQAQQQIRDHFTAEPADALQIITEPVANIDRQDLHNYALRLSDVVGIAQVDTATGSYAGGEQIAPASSDSQRFVSEDRAWFSATPKSDRLEQDATGLVRDARNVEAPFATYVGGATTEVTDFRETLLARMPLVLGLLLAVTFILLAWMTKSLLLPVIATVLNLLSMGVMFGAIVWIFQEGHLADLLGFTATGFIEPSIPILMVCVAYGLSMDYQLFILSRIKEAYDVTRDHRAAVLDGLQHTAPIVLPAAAILALTFTIYLTSSIVQLKMLAVGMSVAIIVDATIIRLLLLPALMQLVGKASWWFPLKRRS